ncbi:MAG: XdhC family protein [Acidimicrobiia bacterium]
MVTQVLDAVASMKSEERLGAMITVIDGTDAGTTAVVDRIQGVLIGGDHAWLTSDVLVDAEELMDREESRALAYGDRRVFIDVIAPSPVMLIFGAGHIAQPLALFARELGFRVIVADARASWATAERFPAVDELIVAWPEAVFDHVTPDRRTYVVLLSHDVRFEVPVLHAIRNTPIRYIGAMGSRRTHNLRIERLMGEGWSEEEVAAIHGPIGLDLKGSTPAETAVAILGEIIQVRYKAGTAVSLSGTDIPIHSTES